MTDAAKSDQTSVRKARRARLAVVDSDSRDKTIKVRIDRLVKHAKYGKYQRRRSVIHVHDEQNEAKVGDVVEIVECRPISKSKSWRLSKVVRRAVQA
ncbi:MAG: 30S ribosomal protein S17 [Planctomycetia bacterium]|nr:30S ribosomal protein S17 [Planctomycetia bacterium]MCC7313698.1 30S ribosomal protein S17 [Planctomycetota bacterium]OQY99696.1 MAG: 30S ribosomal protein S17 [Planctomycetes bacterium UTPLA1]